MTQEQKQLLLVDICARLPYYRLFCQTNKGKGKGTLISVECSFGEALVYVDFGYPQAEEFDLNEDDVVKPYLRPMSSMTEEEKERCDYLILHMEDWLSYYDYLNYRYLDYRGLIPMGLALEAPEGMYDIK